MIPRRNDEAATKGDLDALKQELLAKIEANGEKIDANGEKIEINSEKISRLIDRVVENHTAIGKMLTREEYKKDYDRLLQGQDQMIVILLRIDQERAARNARLDRLETDVERLKAR